MGLRDGPVHDFFLRDFPLHGYLFCTLPPYHLPSLHIYSRTPLYETLKPKKDNDNSSCYH